MLLPSLLVALSPTAAKFSSRAALTWAPNRLQRGPYTGRGPKPVGLVSDRTRILNSPSKLACFPPPPNIPIISSTSGAHERDAIAGCAPDRRTEVSTEAKPGRNAGTDQSHGRETVAAGIPEGFRPVKPGRIGPGGRRANRDGIPIRK